MSIKKRRIETYEDICKAISEDDYIKAAFNKQIETYNKELLAACLTFNVKTFKSVVDKWRKQGFFPDCFELPSDDVLEITLRKIVVNRIDAPKDKQDEAADWLLSRGYDLELE